MTMSKLMPNTGHNTKSHPIAIQVAVAVIVDQAQRVLIARRARHVHQGDCWEFPGGKVDPDETTYDALCREIREELHIHIQAAQPLIKILHHYHDKSVLLDVWRVTNYQGEPQGAEGQVVTWHPVADLEYEQFPAANRKIIFALQYPSSLLITGDFSTILDFNSKLELALQSGVKLVQLRSKLKPDELMYQAIVQSAKVLCETAGAHLLLNSATDMANSMQLGLHLNSQQLHDYQQRPISSDRWLSASCHNLVDIKQAEKLQADFILLSPVKHTSSHPDLAGMGWETFSTLLANSPVPAYALGGLSMADINDARQAGAQGIAAISALWNSH